MTYTDAEVAHEMGRLRMIYQSLPFDEFLYVAAQDILTERFKERESLGDAGRSDAGAGIRGRNDLMEVVR